MWKPRLLKFLKLLRFFIISSMILTLLEITVGYWMLSSRWKIYLSKEQVNEFASEVNAAPSLPENFKRIYKVFYPEDFYASMSQQIFLNYGYRLIFRDPNVDARPHCHCYFIYDIQRLQNKKLRDIEWTGRLEEFEYGFAMEKYSSPEKCMDYALGYRIESLRQYLNPQTHENLIYKSVENMTDDDLIELILLLKDRFKFDRGRYPETFEKTFLEYRAKVDELSNREASLN